VRPLVIALALLLSLGGVAFAQNQPGAPAKPGQPRQAPVRIIDSGAAPGAPAAEAPPPSSEKSRDKQSSNNWAMALLFWAFALGMIGGALFVITRRNLIAAVMGMVGTFFAVAGLYMMLYASFLAVVQMLVYAGAIMVLFVFVVMILNKPEDEPWGLVGLPGKALAGLALAYLTFRLGSLLWSVKAPADALLAPPPVIVPPLEVGEAPTMFDWGSTSGVGWSLFNEYLFPFEAVSILLLVAVVGAIAVARPLKEDDEHGTAPDHNGSDALEAP
jgi:NADH-quinone oxidoreductase subunit J